MTLRWKFSRQFGNDHQPQDEVQLEPGDDLDSVTVLTVAGGHEVPKRHTLCNAVVFFVFLSVVLAVVIVVILIQNNANAATPGHGNCNQDVCLTEGCVLASARVSTAMDKSVNPCDDFYHFACGNWIKTHVIPEDKGAFGTFTKLRDDVYVIVKALLESESDKDIDAVKKAKDYYQACVNETRIEEIGMMEIFNYLEKNFGGWPVLGLSPGGNWNQIAYRLEDLLIKVRRGTNYPPLIDHSVGMDDKHPTNHIYYIDQPELGMPSRDYYLKGRDDPTLVAYQTMIEDMMVAFGADRQVARSDAKDMVDLEVDLANISVPREERRDPEKLYNKMTIADLSQNFTGVDWEYLIKGVFNITGEPITDSEPLIVVSPPFFNKLGGVLARYSDRIITNYVVGQRVLFKSSFLPKKIQNIYLVFKEALYGTATESPRWQMCARTVTDSMPEVVGRLFVMETFKKEAKADVLDLISKLKLAFSGMIDNLSWMEDTTKTFAKEKLRDVEPRIGYPEVVYNDSALNDKFKDVPIFRDNPLKSLISLGDGAVVRRLNKLREKYDKSEWDMSAATVNAYYMPETNQITFPAAILQPPFYTKDQPAYLNYGGIGYVIGHELTHGFDDQGRLYDAQGNLHSWWSDADATRFKDKAQCIIDQYNNFTVPGTGGMTLNGINTQGENIADNGGIKESFMAYRQFVAARGEEEPKLPGLDYTPNQLYFLNAAQVWCENMRDKAKVERILTDPHSIDMFRVYGPMQNFDEFTKAWHCPVGSFMNPKNKCSVW